MTFRQFAFNNVLRNKRLYAAYFLSSLFTVMVFFTFAIFAFHPAFSGGDINSNALFGMAVAGGIIYIFSFFFVLYSMSAFLQSRKKEFGLLMMMGASTRQIRLMVFLENILIGFLATVGGILIGLVFAKVILLLAENVLIIDETLHFYFPTLAIIVTFVSFIILFLVISFFVSFILRTKKLIDLIKGDKQSKGEPKASVVLAVIAALLLIAGYGTAFYVKGLQVVVAMVPVIIVVILGTYLLFTQLSVYIIRRLKQNKTIFWQKTNMLLFSDLSFRMKDNARTFFMVAIISTVAFSAIGTLYGFQSYLTKGVKESSPYSLTYLPTHEAHEKDIKQDVEKMNGILQDEHVKTVMGKVQLRHYDLGINDRDILVASASDYNRLAKLKGETPVHPGKNEAIVVGQSVRVMEGTIEKENLMKSPIKLDDGQEIKPVKKIQTELFPIINGYYIVDDSVIEQLEKPVRSEPFYAWQADNGQTEQMIAAGRKISKEVGYPAQAIDYTVYEINKAYGPILFIGLFIGIVFFVSAGSFLYFRLYSDLDEDKRKFRSIAKMGLTEGELKKVVNRQTALMFFAPIVVALVHGAVALTALAHLFNYNLTTEAIFVLGGFALIQIIYFLIVRFFYIKQIKAAVY
ncbi:ABC transporter permease [Virgibacillus sp. 179-BFC.A HS]|uniref:ABC transporter permease n=1 Tax=Tigheibacillus jepli TaxID=3035914 RepID=A0ABU5CFP5_9BACI|nr:ABC transporter permease [Virgibacillus sp. 179-BFC.A HS]MDY0405153.1 ABC transporter permease [Virgibacillus sp. 179-BFC.A HS]